MRMRKKPNLDKRLAKCEHLMVAEPEANRGRWNADKDELRVEIGCGKGSFTLKTAIANPNIKIVAIERITGALLLALEKVNNADVNNVIFINKDANRFNDYFADSELDGIYINFCDPWPKSRDAKLRLTSPGFLRRYATALKDNGKIYFRTDNLPLFEWSVDQFKEEGWDIIELTNDAHNEIQTDYEAKFSEEGIKINMLTAVKVAGTKSTADGDVPRLRNSALSDARGC